MAGVKALNMRKLYERDSTLAQLLTNPDGAHAADYSNAPISNSSRAGRTERSPPRLARAALPRGVRALHRRQMGMSGPQERARGLIIQPMLGDPQERR